MKESQCLPHLQRLFWTPFSFKFLRATSSRKSSRQCARAPRGMTRFVLKIEILSHIIGTRSDLALTVSSHYGSCMHFKSFAAHPSCLVTCIRVPLLQFTLKAPCWRGGVLRPSPGAAACFGVSLSRLVFTALGWRVGVMCICL